MNNNNKIAIVSASLGVGGAERFAGLLSMMLHDLGYEVHHLIILDVVEYEYRGQLVNLGQMFAAEKGIFRAVKKGKFIAKYLKDNAIETIIDNRSRPTLLREIFTQWIYGKRKTYYMVHSANLEMYLPKSTFWANYLYKNAARIICVSKGIEDTTKQKYGFHNLQTIYNPVLFPEKHFENPDSIPKDYVLFFGRLEEKVKNFTLLLNAYQQSKIYESGIMLFLIGEGSDEDFIKAKIKELQLEKYVLLLPFQQHITPFVQNAICSVLTSHFEGFPMSIVESLAVGTPVISVDCKTGPNEIIQDGFNGLLVENYNEKALAQAFRRLFEEEGLYQNCKKNAKQSIEHLSLTIIASEWKQLLLQK